MATEELFRFVAVRPPNRVLQSTIESRLIRDRRPSPPLLGLLFGPGEFETKLREAEAYAATADFLAATDPGLVALHPVVEFLRRELVAGRPLDELVEAFTAAFPLLARLLEAVPPGDLAEATSATVGRLWDAHYAQIILGCDRFVATNYLVDALRVFHVLLLLWVSRQQRAATWAGGAFDDYDTIVDLQAAAATAAGDRAADPRPPLEDVPRPDPGAETGPMVDLAEGVGVFRVPLRVGAMAPPTVGDLLVVHEDLREYRLDEVADIESIMKGERRERTIRTTARTTTTTTTETVTELEESSSTRMEERFGLAAQSQQTAEQSFGVDVGVSVSAKFGPVQMAATANASFDTSQSSTDSTSQEYAKTVTEEAAKRIKTSIKESSSVTLLTETQDTSLRGFNNQGGTVHVNGLYRWVNKVLDARLMNYGRRLMLRQAVPEPAQFYRSLLDRASDKQRAELVEPVHPSRLDATTLAELPADETDGGVDSYQAVDEANYAELAARYDVTGVSPPPPRELSGGKAIVVPSAMPPSETEDDELNLVLADSGLTIDPDYKLISLGVFAPAGGLGNHRDLADTLHLGNRKDDTDHILVMVGHKEFFLEATGQGNNDPKKIDSNFNSMIGILEHDFTMFGDAVQPAIPITVSAKCAGLVSLNVLYAAERTDEALDRWKAATYAAILKGYTTQRQAYEQALGLIKAQAQSATEAQTFALRSDQYRAIELTELKRGFIELLSEGSAAGRSSISVAEDGTPTIIHHEADAAGVPHWRSPLANGVVADFFERAFEWPETTYEYFPYYWGGTDRWAQTAQFPAADAVFEGFLRAGSAGVVVPVRPGYERPVMFFLKTGLIWGGGYLTLFTSPDMLDVYAGVELATQLDPPVQVGPGWKIDLPTSLIMLQEGEELPTFPPAETPPAELPAEPPPVPGERMPF